MSAFKTGDIVDCPYGRCRVDKKSERTDVGGQQMYVCTPLHWRLAQKCIPVFHINSDYMKNVNLVAGTDIRTNYGGKGVIREVRATEQAQHYIVTLKNWKLAQGQSPILYLEPGSVLY